ncbi:MAG TPA: polymer-forming cytoskeletal protein [Methylomirabilota bacterium]|jgi:cytoskeletal protein CcmA (bactofilin family)|nr:polymer-forming cytoskeletal protein [Methylomirabilota bacterium]
MMWKGKGKTRGKDTGELTAFLDEACQIDGKFTFSGTVMINGRLHGEIHSNDTLIVGEKGVINASIRAGVVLISGEVIGNVEGVERVELRGGARVSGDVEAPIVVVDEGVMFDGHCRMTRAGAEDAREHAVVPLKR